MPDMTSVIEQARSLSIQDRADSSASVSGGLHIVPWMKNAGIVPPWWSAERDKSLRGFWKQSDHLAGAVYTMTSKMTAVPNKVVARDASIKRHVEEAAVMTDVINGAVEWGAGWVDFYGKAVEDLLTQDNGCFAEIIGKGSATGPIIGRPISLAHLDAGRCTRTGNAEFPVVYTDTDGKRYKLHYTRVMYTSQMTSPMAEMFGVGVCAVSRAINVAQNLLDILIYKQEKLGSRPLRDIIITQGGLDPKDLQDAIALAESGMDAMGLTRFSKIIIGGSATMPEADAKPLELSGLPDGFEERDSITLGMATIALAFGVDARELFPAMTAGATRADALLQHLKQRGKGPGQIIQVTEQLFNYKFLPPHLMFMFDFQDDAQDRQVAEIRQIRAERRVQDLSTNAVNDRVIRETMFTDGDIDQSQFARMELEDGRLEDGSSVLMLFYKKNSETSSLLDLGVPDPLDIRNNDAEKMLDAIDQAQRDVMKTWANASTDNGRWISMRAFYALEALAQRYKNPDIFATWGEIPVKQPVQGEYIDPRVRTQDLTTPASNEVNRSMFGEDNDNDETS